MTSGTRTNGSTPIPGGTQFLTTTTATTASTPREIRKLRQLSSSSSFSAITSDEDETEDDRPEWYLKDTSVQFHRSPAEQDPAVGFFCKFMSLVLLLLVMWCDEWEMRTNGWMDVRKVRGWEKRVGRMCGGIKPLREMCEMDLMVIICELIHQLRDLSRQRFEQGTRNKEQERKQNTGHGGSDRSPN